MRRVQAHDRRREGHGPEVEVHHRLDQRIEQLEYRLQVHDLGRVAVGHGHGPFDVSVDRARKPADDRPKGGLFARRRVAGQVLGI